MTAKEMERQARNHYKGWKRSEAYTLEHVYKKHSVLKERAWRHCHEMQTELNGYGLKVITHTYHMFTAEKIIKLHGYRSIVNYCYIRYTL